MTEYDAAAESQWPFANRADVQALRAALARHGLTMTIEPQGVGVDLPIVPVSDGTHITVGPIEDNWPEDGEPPITGWAADHCDDRNIYLDHIAHVHEDQPGSTGDPEPVARAIAAYLATYAPAPSE